MHLIDRLHALGARILDLFLEKKRHATLVDSLPLDSLVMKRKAIQINSAPLITLLDYHDRDVEAAIRALKYENSRKAAKMLAGILAAYISTLPRFETPTRIVAVPLHKNRLLKRGYNQVERVLASLPDSLLREKNLHICREMLRRVKDTAQQTRLQKDERKKNVLNAFQTSKDYDDEMVFLIDDVTTTGATLAEARVAIEKAGVKKVVCLALAHA